MSILSNNALRQRLEVQLPSSVQLNKARREKQRVNTATIFQLEREGLKHNSFERRMQIYATKLNEKIYIEYPGKETEASVPMPKDTCPGYARGTEMIELDTSFGDIWDVMDIMGRRHQADLPLLATVLIRMANMVDYKKKNLSRECFDITINEDGRCYDQSVPQMAEFFVLDFPKRTWDTLNDKFSGISIKGQEMSFEAFMKYFDVLLMNEDSKYAYKGCVLDENPSSYENWKYDKGRVKTIGTCLNVVGYLEEAIKMSDLLDGFQKGRGTMLYPISKYSLITENLVRQ